MRISISSADGLALKSQKYSFHTLENSHSVRDELSHYNDRFLKGRVREIIFDGVFMAHSVMDMGSLTRASFINDHNYIEMHFMLKGYSYISDCNSKRHINVTANTHDILFLNGVEGFSETYGTPMESFQIIFAPSYYQKYFPFDLPALEKFARSIKDKATYDHISNHHSIINYQIYQLIQDILTCSRTGISKRLYLESKVMELLILQIDSLTTDTGNHDTLCCSKTETEKLYAVKEFIENNLTDTFNLTNIACKFNTNEFSLNKHFKKLFGTTVYQYFLGCRMKKAAYLLSYHNFNINEVAYEIGYKNPQHFTAAFKRKFGYLPSELK